MQNNSEWISVNNRIPDEAGIPVFVSAVNCYNQRREFIAFQGYGDFLWHTADMGFMTDPRYGKTAVSEKWQITHWRPMPVFDCVKLELVDSRPKSEKYACSKCGGICYYPHSLEKIPYKYCPHCGKEVRNDE